MDGPHKGKPRAAETSQMQCERRAGTNWFFIEIDILKCNQFVTWPSKRSREIFVLARRYSSASESARGLGPSMRMKCWR